MIRSLVYTLLLEEPEFRQMAQHRGERLVTDAVTRVEQDQAADPGMTTAQSIKGYISDVTGRGRCEAGIWQRYVDTLLVGDERRQEAEEQHRPLISTPPAAVDALGETTTYEDLIDFATDSTRFDGDLVDLF